LALLIFFIGNLGSRILALGEIFSWFRQPKKASSFQIFLLTSLLVSALIPLLFIQKGNSWNTIQFFYYFLFLSGLLAALWLGRLLAKKKVWMKILVLFLLIVFTIPTTLGTLKHYLPYRAPARVGFEELEALSFLSRQAQGIVLAYPHDYSLRAENEAPKPLFVYETTAYVSALSDKIVFLEDEMNLEIMQVDWRFRRQESENFFKTNDLQWAKEFLNKNKIKYLYLLDGQALVLNSEKLELREIFDNGLVKIFQKSIIILNKDEN